MLKWATSKKIIQPYQLVSLLGVNILWFGFRQGHSTVLQLAKIIDDITKKFNLNQSTSMIALDIERAFDTVWHSALIAKMVQLNIPNYLVKLTISYLRNRSFQVKVNKKLSEIKKIPAGIPQGLLLSPNLFTIFITKFLYWNDFFTYNFS